MVGNGSVGKGGKGVGLGKVGTTGTVCTEGVVVCKRLRAAKLRLMLDNMLKTTKKAKMKHLLDAMMEKEIVFLKVLKRESKEFSFVW